jgi:hypothetical protein
MRVKFWLFTFTVFFIVACGVRRLEAIPSFKEEEPVEVKALTHCSCDNGKEWDEAE